MIKSFEALAGVLSEFENRIAYLENLHQMVNPQESIEVPKVETIVKHVTVVDHVRPEKQSESYLYK